MGTGNILHYFSDNDLMV